MSWLTPARVRTLVWIAVGAAVFVVVWGAALMWWPDAEPPREPTTRVLAALSWLRWPAAIVLAMIMSLFRIADRESALDPIDGEPSRRHRVNQRVLDNTVEQLAAFVPSLCALAAVADQAATWRLVPIAVAAFCVGRLLFWVGYHVTPNARGLGFNLTFSTTAVVLAAAFVLA